MVQKNRVVLANESRLLRDMLKRAIDKTSDLEVVDEVLDPARLVPVVETRRAHWAIVSLSSDGSMPAVADRVVRQCTSASILGVAIDGTVAKIRSGTSDERVLDHLSLPELISVLTKDGLPTRERPRERLR